MLPQIVERNNKQNKKRRKKVLVERRKIPLMSGCVSDQKGGKKHFSPSEKRASLDHPKQCLSWLLRGLLALRLTPTTK